jgi:hypothetical protein
VAGLMAKIPDGTDLGSRVIANGRVPQRREDRSAEIAFTGLANTAEQMGKAVREFAQHDDQFNFARARSALLTSDAAMRAKLADDPDWGTHENRYAEEMNTQRETASRLIRGSRSRALFDADARLDVDRGTHAIRAQAKVKEGQWGRSELDNALQTNRTAALETKDEATREQLVRGTVSAIDGALDSQYITPEQAVELRQRWTASYGEGFVDVQASPAAQLKILKNPKGTPADFIAPDKRADMIRRIEDHMRVEGDRREAKAERALNAFEMQIAAGVPTTPQMQTELRATIAGTSVQGEFDDVMSAEKEVQETLRKPIGEQLRLVQQKEAAINTTGGTMREARNVARLKGAVTQNVALLQTSPLLFAEKRLDSPNTPLDVSSVLDPQARAEVASTMQDRAAQLRALSKRFGAAVPMKPLLPQEAAQLGELLEKASPAQTTEIFAGLHEAAGTPDVFRGTMAQIAPDHPVLSRAGNLAAMQRDLVTNRAFWWFTPDASVASRDVATTLIRGDRILNPSKAEKGQDGAPQKKLLLPEDKTLQQRVAREVGTAFAGRDDDLEKAFQVVKAYYAGRASETGLVAKDPTDIDNKLVREAVRATLGNVVNYNGNGDVLAPWGMSENDFEDRVERAFTEEAKHRNIPIDGAADSSAFGLTNAGGDGQYAVTLGKKLLFDDTGKPVVLDLKPRDPRDARGYIRRDAK